MPIENIDLNPLVAEYGLLFLMLVGLAFSFWKIYAHSRQDRKDADAAFYKERERFIVELKSNRIAHQESMGRVADKLDGLREEVRRSA
tara:strand:- start:28 stop:291 length:264 start_codon:yes stop_codon:yes gene_type:complete